LALVELGFHDGVSHFKLIPIGKGEILIQTVLVHDAVPVLVSILEIVQNAVRIDLRCYWLEGAGSDHRRGKRIETAPNQNADRQMQNAKIDYFRPLMEIQHITDFITA
jgi:hypothetical protein